jgi:hypothetical protein
VPWDELKNLSVQSPEPAVFAHGNTKRVPGVGFTGGRYFVAIGATIVPCGSQGLRTRRGLRPRGKTAEGAVLQVRRHSRVPRQTAQRQLAGGDVPRADGSRVRPRPTRLDVVQQHPEATSPRAGARVCAPGAASDRMGKRQKAPYSRLGPPRPHSSPLLSTLSSLLSRPQAGRQLAGGNAQTQTDTPSAHTTPAAHVP